MRDETAAGPSVQLSIVIPALDEEKTVAICVQKAMRSISQLGAEVEGEVVVADNGSVDRTAEVAEAMGARVVPATRKGYGNALMAGLGAARGEYLVMADADDSYDLEEAARFYHKLKEGYDFVIGNRFRGRIEKGSMPFLHRYLGTPVLGWVMNLFFRTGIGDVNCGMRGLSKEAFREMRLRAGGMEFATEMVVKASIRRLRIAEIPCNLYRDKRDGQPHLSTWRDGWRHLRFMLLFTPLWTFLIPGVLLTLLGGVGLVVLALRDVVNPEALPLITQKHMLSSMLLFLTGSYIFQLGLIARTFSYSKHFDHASVVARLLSKYFRLERGILLGGALAALGGLIFVYLGVSFYSPYLIRFSDLIRFDMAVFAITCFLLGIQFVFTSFVLSLFYLKVK